MNYKKYLTDNILPFWLDNAIDKEKGGIFYSLDKNGNNDCKDKNIWFSGRALWSFANAYNTVDKKTEYFFRSQSMITNGKYVYFRYYLAKYAVYQRCNHNVAETVGNAVYELHG